MRRHLTKYVVSTVLGVLLIWLAFRNEDWSAFWTGVRAVDVPTLAFYGLVFFSGHLLRVARWGVLVRALGEIRWRDVVSAGAVGYMCIFIFPFRLGEFVRPYLVRGKGGVTASGALATIVVERVIDGLLLVGLFFFFLNLLPSTGNPDVEKVKVAAWVAGAVFVSALIVLIAGYVARRRTVELIEAIGDRIHAGLTRKVVGLLVAFLDGLRILNDPRRIAIFLVFTFLYWGILGWGMEVMAWAVGIPEVGLVEGFALLAVVVVGIMVPAGPGFTGTFELALKAGFSLVALSADSASRIAVYIIVLHVIQLFIQVSFGAIYLLTGQIDFRQALEATDDGEGDDSGGGDARTAP